MRTIRRYGWVRDHLDRRDRPFLGLAAPSARPPVLTVAEGCPPVYDQGLLGSCTAHAAAAAVQFDERMQGMPTEMPSRLFIYYDERLLEGTVHSDSGAQIRDAIKALATWGAPPETLWPYDVTRFSVKPPIEVYAAATIHRALQYERLPQTVDALAGCLVAGYPVLVGFEVFPSFKSDAVERTGDVPTPGAWEDPIGGHCVLVTGYDDPAQRFEFRNSWGPAWGRDGYGTLPYATLTDADLAGDFWTLRVMS